MGKMNAFIVLIFSSLVLVLVSVNGAIDTSILCTEAFCDEYLTSNNCPDLPSNCNIQNETHNGIFLPYAGPCDCCEYCVANLDDGDSCAIGTPSSPVPRVICGDLLYCNKGEDDNTCGLIQTTCTADQTDYDDRRDLGTLGHLEMRDSCQRRGLYEPFKCIPGEICYCVNEDGERIFGEMPFTILAPTIMNCACSRRYEEASQFLQTSLYNTQFLRCRSNGDYDPLQCINDDCFCVHAEDGTLALNRFTSVNMTSISNETISCFDNSTHIEGEYFRDCEAQVAEILGDIATYEALGFEVIGYSFPNCQLDGYYAAVQENITHKYCSDYHGEVLEDFVIDIDDPLAADMKCNCARSRYISVGDKPQCCRDGSYNPMQCRRGLCRCVDENGNQVAQEVHFLDNATLECFERVCQDLEETPEEEEEGGEEEL